MHLVVWLSALDVQTAARQFCGIAHGVAVHVDV